jgi:hypothetical protein
VPVLASPRVTAHDRVIYARMRRAAKAGIRPGANADSAC